MDTFASLDELIANLRIRDSPTPTTDDRIRALRTRRNALTPLCHVPADVLVQILELLRFPAIEEELDDTISDNVSEDVPAAWRREKVDKDREYEEIIEWYRRDLSDDEDAYPDLRIREEDDEDSLEDSDNGCSNDDSEDGSDDDSEADAEDKEDANDAEGVTPHVYESLIPCRQYPKDLARIASTCSHIRAVALTSPSLWSCLFLPSPSNMVALWLERAQSYPLILSFDERKHRPEAIPGYELVKPAMRRARHVAVEIERLRNAPELNAKKIQAALDEPMPALVSLAIRSSGFNVALTPRFLDGCARSLTSLVLSSVQLPWDAVDLVALTHLDVTGVPGTHALARVLNFLSRLAALRSLALTCLHVERPEPRAVLPGITLPHLESLKLCHYMRTLDVLSAALPVPCVRYELLSFTGGANEGGPAVAVARTRVFECVQCLADDADVCLFYDGWSVYMQVEARGAACTRAVFLDRADAVEDLACYLGGVRRLCVRGGAARPLFEYAANHPAEALVNLEHLIIEGWAPEPPETGQLSIWLAARAKNPRGARLRVLDFRGCGTYLRPEELAREDVQLVGLVDSVL